MQKNNPYRKPTEEEANIEAKKQADLAKLRKETEELANKCITHEYFVKYKDKYETMRKVTIDSLIDYIEPDPLKYAFAVSKALAKLHQLRLLLDGVSADNRPKPKR